MTLMGCDLGSVNVSSLGACVGACNNRTACVAVQFNAVTLSCALKNDTCSTPGICQAGNNSASVVVDLREASGVYA